MNSFVPEMVRHKIINDPVHGFIEIRKGLILEIIDSQVFQRLRRIRQLALSSMVYPGAVHSRFNHCIGAMYLTRQAMEVLIQKDVEITDEEFEGTLLAILLHDIGHGPFSHALESVILQGLHHEKMSKAIMQWLNKKLNGKLELAIKIFEGNYHKHFLHQLVSSQLDMDRLDYLVRDSYFTRVIEGMISVDRIIKTLNVRKGKLVVESKGIYSVEKFLVARRLMYWQVYLHKAVIAAEYMIVNILKRARELMYSRKKVWSNEVLDYFFRENTLVQVDISEKTIQKYSELDDEDILYAIKQWKQSDDPVLKRLCTHLLDRKLLKVILQRKPFNQDEILKLRKQCAEMYDMTEQEAKYFVMSGEVSNLAYLHTHEEPIEILEKDGSLLDIAEASDLPNIQALSHPVTKYFLILPEELK